MYDVVWSATASQTPSPGSSHRSATPLDLNTATYTNTIGATTCPAVWTDPEFDPTQRAFYYARVLEIPTPRWSVFDALTAQHSPAGRASRHIQERAYTSAVWYTPSEQELARGREGAVTVAGLEAQRLRPLSDDELRALIVGKSMRIRSLLTGQEAIAYYTEDGKRTLTDTIGFAGFHGGSTAATNPYEIRGGRLHSSLDDGSKFSSLIFRVGGRHLMALNLEAGYLNWEMSPA